LARVARLPRRNADVWKKTTATGSLKWIRQTDGFWDLSLGFGIGFGKVSLGNLLKSMAAKFDCDYKNLDLRKNPELSLVRAGREYSYG